ncbi:TraR/DksA C4-type zinc finger protein [Acidiferrimicrobium sp. IK]|uniref:TraR/DksA family transcriptional regulator n=1 Tax=Acidiferrimicrobium sp. IK TaxID=2871700 RepID=UPI0021CB086F|nr:TraR/DksA C4-type zinc finger protein [Acidiferrimicrobium sp. IK]MCU4183383.1 TraR/DksA C4-type zinc finger protein [Acidiferrimicrobium sp. IK]
MAQTSAAQTTTDTHRAQLEAARTELEGRLASLRSELQAVEEGDADVSFDEEGGEGSGVSVDRDRLVSLIATLEAQLNDTDASLAAVVAGTYGICESCGDPIPAERLEAVPNARLCVSCKAGGISGRRAS